jgi:hypothetical protein
MLGKPHRTWQIQPPPGMRVLTGHPLAQGLRAYWLFSGGGIAVPDLLGVHHATRATAGIPTPAWVVRAGGRSPNQNGAANQHFTMANPGIWTGGHVTVAGSVIPLDNAVGQQSFIFGINAGDNQGFRMENNAGTWRFVVGTGSGNSVISDASVVLGRHYLLVGTAKAGDQRFYVNGRLAASASPSAVNIGGITTGAYLGAGNAQWTGVTFWVAVWERALTPPEALWLTADPFAFLVPQGYATSLASSEPPSPPPSVPLMEHTSFYPLRRLLGVGLGGPSYG